MRYMMIVENGDIQYATPDELMKLVDMLKVEAANNRVAIIIDMTTHNTVLRNAAYYMAALPHTQDVPF